MKKAETKSATLQRIELDSVFNALPDLIFLMDENTRIIDYRAGNKSDLYVSPSTFLGKNMHDVVPEHVGTLFAENIALVKKDKELITFQYQLVLPEGKKHFEVRLNQFDNTELYVAIVRDVSDQIVSHNILTNSEEIYRQMFEKNQAVKLIIDPVEGYIIEANESALKFYGYDAQTMSSMRISDINMLGDEKCKTDMTLAVKENSVFYNIKHKLASGEVKDVEVYSGPVKFGRETFLYSIIHDVTNQKKSEAALIETKQRLRDFFDHTPSILYVKDIEGRYLSINRRHEEIFNIPEKDIIGKTDFDVFSLEMAESCYETDLEVIKSVRACESEETVEIENSKRVYHTLKYPLINTQGELYAVGGITTDVTQKKEVEEKIFHQAHFDTLTNLPNRLLALDRLSQLLTESSRKCEKVAVLFLDLDDFKKINDSLGHEVGDKVLIESAQRLTEVLRNEDTVARLGGDEFIILVRGLLDSIDVRPIAESVLNCFRNTFKVNSRELLLTASVGVAVYPEDGTTSSELLRNSDTAMYQAKALGRNTFSYFTEAMNTDISRRLLLEEQIRLALDKNEFEVFYQPQFNVATQNIMGAEALLRWNNAELGSVSPVEFIPVAEDTGLIVAIGKYVLTEALSVLSKWQRISNTEHRMAVNLSPIQFRDADLIDFIENTLKKSNIPARCLELEITEGVLMEEKSYIDDALSALCKLGVKISMDDFGTGYSSLSYLRQYPFNILKVDRSFIKDLTEDSASCDLVNAAIAMAHSLGLKVVAEGVETKEQLQILNSLTCDYFQGFYLGKPMNKNDLFEFVNSYSTN